MRLWEDVSLPFDGERNLVRTESMGAMEVMDGHGLFFALFLFFLFFFFLSFLFFSLIWLASWNVCVFYNTNARTCTVMFMGHHSSGRFHPIPSGTSSQGIALVRAGNWEIGGRSWLVGGRFAGETWGRRDMGKACVGGAPSMCVPGAAVQPSCGLAGLIRCRPSTTSGA